jgi:hypothetical protein
MSSATRVLTVYLEDVSGEGLERIKNSLAMTKGVLEVKEVGCPTRNEIYLAQIDLRKEIAEVLIAILNGKKVQVIE